MPPRPGQLLRRNFVPSRGAAYIQPLSAFTAHHHQPQQQQPLRRDDHSGGPYLGLCPGHCVYIPHQQYLLYYIQSIYTRYIGESPKLSSTWDTHPYHGPNRPNPIQSNPIIQFHHRQPPTNTFMHAMRAPPFQQKPHIQCQGVGAGISCADWRLSPIQPIHYRYYILEISMTLRSTS